MRAREIVQGVWNNFYRCVFCSGTVKPNACMHAASYRIRDSVLKHGLEEAVKENGRRFFLEHEGMPGKLCRRIPDDFKSCAYTHEKEYCVQR